MVRALIVCGFLVGCGVGQGDDSPGTGSNMPPAPPPPAANNVTMTVHLGAEPAPNVPVIFQTNEGADMGVAMTDATGVAAGSLPLGGTVSIVFPGTPSTVYSYLGVKPADQLSFIGPASTTDTTTINVIVPPAPSGGQVTITTACGQTTGDAPMIALDLTGCGTQTDFYVSDGVTAGFLKRAPIAPEVDLSAETYNDAVATTLSVTDLPDDGSATLEKRLETDLLHPAFTTGALDTTLDTADATVDASVPDVSGIQQLVVATVNDDDGSTTIAARAAYTSTPTEIDVGPALLPAVSLAALASSSVSWSEEGMGGNADFTVVALRTPTVTHMLATLHHDASVVIPELPTAYNQYNLATDDLPAIDVTLVRATGGYDAVRANVFNGDLTELAPMDGTVSLSVSVAQPQ
jgi:hypothetical protein